MQYLRTITANMKPDQSRLTTLLTDTVILLCKNGLNFQSTLRIEGVLGITIDDSDVFIVHLNETVSSISQDPYENTSIFGETTEKLRTPACDSIGTFSVNKKILSDSTRVSKSITKISNKSVALSKKTVSSIEISNTASPSINPSQADTCDTLEASTVCIKEESPEDSDIILPEVEDKNYSRGNEHLMHVSKHRGQLCEWTREGGHVSMPGQSSKYCSARANDPFSQNEGSADAHGGMNTEDWHNLSAALAASGLPGGTEGETPWQRQYVWGNRSCTGDYLPGSSGQMALQSMVWQGRASKMEEDTPDGGSQLEIIERHGFALLKPYACPVVGCNRRFYHRNNVYRHRKQKHGNVLSIGFVSRRH